ncbi:MAG: hypothetical protein JWQ94_2324 [Tardiphaga sp.]|nr:hypothetical protein [Tardiphaga sp.]
MTRTLLILVLLGVAVVGAAVATIVGRDRVPAFDAAAVSSVAVTRGPVANRANKKDRLVTALETPPDIAVDSLRQAFAADSPLAAQGNTVLAPIVIPSQQPARPKLAAPPAQKSYSLLSDAQIAAIKGRLNLTEAQQQNWPAVEEALRAVARRIHASRQANPSGAPINLASTEVQQLKSAAMPLLFQLREDQKREVRSLARLIGLNAIASAI